MPQGVDQTAVRRQGPLTKGKIIQAALSVLKKQGLSALHMRAIAEKLGVKSASLYNHIRNKAELLDGILDNILEGMPSVHAESWEEYLKKWSHAFRNQLLQHTDSLPLLLSHPWLTLPALHPTEQMATVLHKAGFEATHCWYIQQSLHAWIIGHVVLEAAPSVHQTQPPLSGTLGSFPLVKTQPINPLHSHKKCFEFHLCTWIQGLRTLLQTV